MCAKVEFRWAEGAIVITENFTIKRKSEMKIFDSKDVLLFAYYSNGDFDGRENNVKLIEMFSLLNSSSVNMLIKYESRLICAKTPLPPRAAKQKQIIIMYVRNSDSLLF